eukprot:augustus_masked-scaffold_6-processed-gene-3.5-mRNA-1 protein AED:1.00 eAED:1.00 QI:0/-1/0/0/-1/1/1/0/203
MQNLLTRASSFIQAAEESASEAFRTGPQLPQVDIKQLTGKVSEMWTMVKDQSMSKFPSRAGKDGSESTEVMDHLHSIGKGSETSGPLLGQHTKIFSCHQVVGRNEIERKIIVAWFYFIVGCKFSDTDIIESKLIVEEKIHLSRIKKLRFKKSEPDVVHIIFEQEQKKNESAPSTRDLTFRIGKMTNFIQVLQDRSEILRANLS